MLAVLTETLDSIPVDEDGLPSFDALTDGDVTNENDASPLPMPNGTPPPQETEEPSLVRNYLPTLKAGVHGCDVALARFSHFSC